MSGISQDMRELEASESPRAREAIAYFAERIRRELAGLAATVEGVEGVVFTGGIGEHSWRTREAVLKGMEWMGIVMDEEANRTSAQIISSQASPTAVFVIPTDEERMIGEHTVVTAGLAGKDIGGASSQPCAAPRLGEWLALSAASPFSELVPFG